MFAAAVAIFQMACRIHPFDNKEAMAGNQYYEAFTEDPNDYWMQITGAYPDVEALQSQEFIDLMTKMLAFDP